MELFGGILEYLTFSSEESPKLHQKVVASLSVYRIALQVEPSRPTAHPQKQRKICILFAKTNLIRKSVRNSMENEIAGVHFLKYVLFDFKHVTKKIESEK